MGRHILVLTIPAAGHVMPTLGLVAELVRRGHRVSYIGTEEFASALEPTGADVLLYDSPLSQTPSLMENVNPFSQVVQALTENTAIAGAATARFADAPPDLVAYDPIAYTAGRVLSRAWRVPAVMLSPTITSGPLYSVEAAIVERSPGQGKDDLPSMSEYFLGLGRFVADYGPNLTVIDDLFGTAEGLTIVTIPREFQPAGDTFDERWVFAGPCLDDRAFQGQWQPAGTDPVLLVSLGRSGYEGQLAFLQTCVLAFAGLPWQVIISTGAAIDPAELGSLPPNVEAHRDVPQLEILKSAKLFVSHAGMGGTMEALSLGVPTLGLPQLPEHAVNADRIAELGLGRRITPDISPDELRAAALDLVADESAARALAHIRECIQKAGGAPRAADEIESYMLQFGR